MPVVVHEAPIAKVRIPASLEHSLRRALAHVHAPFFATRERAAVAVVLREDEWGRLAKRFASAVVERGFRLISLDAFAHERTRVTQLQAMLAAEGIQGIVLASFHRDHLLIPATKVDHCLAVLDRLFSATLQ